MRDALLMRTDRFIPDPRPEGAALSTADSWPGGKQSLACPISRSAPPFASRGRAESSGRSTKLALGWVRAFPDSPDALNALAIAQEMTGDPHAQSLESIARARTLLSPSRGSLDLAAMEVWLRVKRGAPDDLKSLRRARLIADSLLQSAFHPDRRDAAMLAELAGLTGRPGLRHVRSRHHASDAALCRAAAARELRE